GQLEVVAPSRVGVGMILGTAGYSRLATRPGRAATDAVERLTTDPAAQVFTCVVGGLHWLGAGNWAEVDAGYAKAMQVAARAHLHRWTDEVILLAAVTRYLTARYEEAMALGAEAMPTGRERRDPMVHLWGLLILAEVAVRMDAHDPRIEGWMAEAVPLFTRGVAARRHGPRSRRDGALPPIGRPARRSLAVGHDRRHAHRRPAVLCPIHPRSPRGHPGGLPRPPGAGQCWCRSGRAAIGHRPRGAPAGRLRPLLPDGTTARAGLPGLVRMARRKARPGGPGL